MIGRVHVVIYAGIETKGGLNKMILNKNQFKKNINNVKLKRIYNFDKDNKIPVGSVGEIVHVQTNACRVKYDCLDKELWIHYDNIEIKDNRMYYYSYVDESRRDDAIIRAQELDIQLLPVSDDDKMNNNRYSNYKYVFKYVIIINEIIESE